MTLKRLNPNDMLRDLERIERRLAELDAQRGNPRDIEAEALDILRRKPKENAMSVPADELKNRITAPFSRTLTSTSPTSGMTPVPRADRSRPLPENYFEGQRSGASIVKPGAFGVPTSNSPGTVSMGNPPDALTPRAQQPGGGFSRTLSGGTLGAESTATGPVPRTTVTPNPSANGGAQFWQDQQASIPRVMRPSASPDQVATIQRPDAPRMLTPSGGGYAFDQAVRNMEMAQNKAEFDSKKVQRSRARDATNQQVVNFWADQANSIGPGAAQRMAEQQNQQQNENFRTLTRTAADQNINAGRDAAGLAGIQAQQEGQNYRTLTRRPSDPFPVSGNRFAVLGADGVPQLLSLEDGTPLQGQAPQIDQNALGKLTTDLAGYYLGADEYGMVPDATTKEGVRPATAQERANAYQQAAEAARSTLGGAIQRPDVPQGGNPQASATPRAQSPASSQRQTARPASLDEFLQRARAMNPGYTDAELAVFFHQNYMSR
ncbi:MAG: hypothetical protein R3F10_03500 [Lysobacteraceae bacterium]